jgi:hypothetical protein
MQAHSRRFCNMNFIILKICGGFLTFFTKKVNDSLENWLLTREPRPTGGSVTHLSETQSLCNNCRGDSSQAPSRRGFPRPLPPPPCSPRFGAAETVRALRRGYEDGRRKRDLWARIPPLPCTFAGGGARTLGAAQRTSDPTAQAPA